MLGPMSILTPIAFACVSYTLSRLIYQPLSLERVIWVQFSVADCNDGTISIGAIVSDDDPLICFLLAPLLSFLSLFCTKNNFVLNSFAESGNLEILLDKQ